jgi:hypothetical protein
MFGLHAAVPACDLDPERRTRIHQQARTLAVMLQRMQTTRERVDQCPNALVPRCSQHMPCLAAQALQHVRLKRERG